MKFISELSWDDIVVAQKQTHELWGAGYTLGERLDRLKKMIEWPNTNTLWMSGVKDSNGELLASMKRYHFDLEVQGARRKALGVGAFFCAPEARGQGIPARMLEAVLTEEKMAGVEVALLYSAIPIAYYEALKFKPIFSERWSIDLPVEVPARREQIDHNFILGPKLDGRAAKNFYDASVRNAVRTVLDEAQWNFFRFLNRGTENFSVVRNGVTLGYFNPLFTDDKCFLEDCAISPSLSPVEVQVCWDVVRSFAVGRKARVLAGWSTNTPVPTGAIVETREKTHAMLRSLTEELSMIGDEPVHLTPSDYF